MDLRYVYNDSPVAAGERTVLYENGKLYVRTSYKGTDFTDPDNIIMNFRLREVYDKQVVVPMNTPPVGGNGTMVVDV